MARVGEIAEPGNDPALAAAWATDRERYGAPLNTTKVLARRPGILAAARGLAAAVDGSGLLPRELLALVYLRVALLNGCPF